MEKNDERTETLVDHLTTKKDSGSNKQIKKSYQGDEDHSLLGGAKQRSKSKEALKKQNQRARRVKNLSKEEMEKQQSKERARKKEAYERNKDEILSNRQNYYSQNKDDILSSRQHHYSQNKDDILSNRQNHYIQNKDDILSNRQQHYSQNKDDILSKRQHHYTQNKDDILSNRQNHYKSNQTDILNRKRNNYNDKKGVSSVKSIAKRYKGAKAHQRKMRLAKNLKLSTVRMHDESYKANRQDIIANYQNFYNLIKYGPDFVCTCCHRSLFENQVKKLPKGFNTTVKIDKQQYECSTDKMSFDGDEYICESCYNNLNKEICQNMRLQMGMNCRLFLQK